MKVVRVATTLAVVALGGVAMVALIKSRPEAKKVAPEERGTLVEVTEAQPEQRAVPIVVHGNVLPAREMTVVPQVSGRVVEHHAQLVLGGYIAEGEQLLHIEDTDYTLQVAQLRAQVEQARQSLDIEKGRQAVAQREWKLMGSKSAGSKARATREPQIKAAEASLAGARAAMRMASVNVGRTRIKAPFNATVLQESVDVGQVVGAGAPIARLVGTDRFWVESLVPVRELPNMKMPARGDRGAEATVALVSGPRRVTRKGHVLRKLPELDAQSRMAKVIVAVDDPLALELDGEPLPLRAFVEVQIDGPQLEGVFAIKRSALREGDTVWLVGDEGRLVIREVEVTRRLEGEVLVRAGLSPGDRVITSRLASPVEGMALRIKGAAEAKVAKAPASSAGSTP